jgi:hypothetical protein
MAKRVGLENIRYHDSAISSSHIIEGMRQDARMLPDGVLPKVKNGASRKNDATVGHEIN